jgi:hypothetical protein
MPRERKVDDNDIMSFIADYKTAHGGAPSHAIIARRFNVARSTITTRIIGLQAPVQAAPRYEADAPAFMQARQRLRRQREEATRDENRVIAFPRAEMEGESAPAVHAAEQETIVPQAKPVETAPNPAAADASADALPRFILVAMVLIGAGCAVMSAINTATFLVNAGRPFALAVATAVLTTLFSGTAFFAGSLCFKRKNIFASGLFCLLAVCVITFSVFSTIAVSYENLKTAEAASAEAREFVSQTADLLAINKREQEDIASDIALVAAEKERLYTDAGYWANKSWAKHDAILTSIEERDARIDTRRVRQGELLAEERVLKSRGLETATASARTVYTFISGGNPRTERAFRFAALAIPAVFFDIASPLMLGVALLFFQKRRLTSESFSRVAVLTETPRNAL